MIGSISQVQRAKLPREFSRLAGQWGDRFSAQPLDFLWKGYAQLKQDRPPTMVRTDERQISQHLVIRVGRAMTGFEPYSFVQKPNIEESQVTPSAQPPEPDLGFILHADERVIWPIEAKLLHNDGDTSAYISEIRDNFVSRRYAPFSDEVALLGYLLSGSTENVFNNLASSLAVALQFHPAYPDRPQRMSQHTCVFVSGKSPFQISPGDSIICHHLILEF